MSSRMARISTDTSSVYLDFVIAAKQYIPAVISYYDRSLQSIKAFSASINVSMRDIMVENVDGKNYVSVRRPMGDTFSTYIQPVVVGKEKFYHAVSINNSVNDGIILLEKGKEGEGFYNHLMKKFDFPLLREWGDAMYEWAENNACIDTDYVLYKNEVTLTSSLPVRSGKEVQLTDLMAVVVTMDNDSVKLCIEELFKEGKICISKKPQKHLSFENTDEYLKKYGHTLVKNLSDLLTPLRTLDGEAKDFTLNNMRLYPQQIAQVNGDVALLENGKYAILNHGMGTGKVRRLGVGM